MDNAKVVQPAKLEKQTLVTMVSLSLTTETDSSKELPVHLPHRFLEPPLLALEEESTTVASMLTPFAPVPPKNRLSAMP